MKLCFYSCCNESYIPFAIQTLYSIQLQHPNYDYFVICDSSNVMYTEMCKRFNITLRYTNIHHYFNRYTSRHWPSYCFWILYGIHIFENEYDYCCSVDGDMYCHKPLNFSILNNQKDLYVVRTRRCINTGFVIYNISSLLKKHFFDVVLQLYKTFSFQSDQHLLIHFVKHKESKPFQIQYINSSYNYTLGYENIHSINIPRHEFPKICWKDGEKGKCVDLEKTPNCLNISLYHFVYKWWVDKNNKQTNIHPIYKYAYALHKQFLYTYFSKEEEHARNDKFKILLFNKMI